MSADCEHLPCRTHPSCLFPGLPTAELRADRDRWIRLYNRLEAAIRRHVEAKEASGFSDEADDALASAHRAVTRDSTRTALAAYLPPDPLD